MTQPTPSASAWQRPHTVVLPCFFSTFVCHIDRVNISMAIIPMVQRFGTGKQILD